MYLTFRTQNAQERVPTPILCLKCLVSLLEAVQDWDGHDALIVAAAFTLRSWHSSSTANRSTGEVSSPESTSTRG